MTRPLAEAELRRRLRGDAEGFVFRGSGVQHRASTSLETRQFTFRKSYSKDLALEITIETAGARVIGFTVTPQISPEHVKRFSGGRGIQIARGIAIMMFVLVGIVYVMARFVRRLREQEIPLKRAMIVTAFVFVAFAFATFAGGVTQRIDAIERAGPTGVADDVMRLVMSLVVGAIVGLTWGACEPDVRENYPEKLTSTDALLGGFLTARAVRSSLLLGLALAGYAILLSGLEAFLRTQAGVWTSISPGELVPAQARWPALAVLLFALSNIPTLVALTLAAASATHRKGRTRTAQIAFAAVVIAFYLLSSIGGHQPAAWGAIPAILGAAVLLVPFFLGDVLTVGIVSAVTTWVGFCATLLAQPAPLLRTTAIALLALLAVVVIAVTIAAFRRRDETAAEVETVRPDYVRNIAERLLLVTEMDAARQAQLRVMPRIVPTVAGTRLAARHSESAEIGSNYYEFFPSDGFVSVAVADARLPGLSSALCVSMLKGLLLNYAARLTNPRDVADRVYRQLATIFGENLPVSFFFGRLDRSSGTFTFATFGDAPHAVLMHNGATSLEGEELAELIDTTSDAIVIYTARLAELRDRDGATLGDDALHRELEVTNSGEPQQLVDALFDLATRQSRGVDVPQSWTAVALALEGARA
jgi:MFS family permease